MNSAERTIRIIDGEFTIDEIDWGDLSGADVKAGVADLLKHGILIRNEGGAYQRTGKGDGEKGWWATSRAAQKLSPTGKRVFAVLVTTDVIRLFVEIKGHVKDATTEDIFDLITQFEAAYHGDLATAADHLRDGKVKIRGLSIARLPAGGRT